MTEPIFKSAHDALTFAFNFSSQQYSKSAMINFAELPVGRGLGGIDGAAQAGMIRSQVKSLGRIPEAIITVKYAPQSILSSTCVCPACNGLHPNLERKSAIFTLAEHINVDVCKHTSRELRLALIARYFGIEKLSMIEIAKLGGVHPNSASKYARELKKHFVGEQVLIDVGNSKEKRFFPGIETRTMRDIEQILQDLKIVG